MMPCGWGGNRRSGITLAMHHRLQWFIHLWAHGLDMEMSTPPTLSCGVWPIYLLPTYKTGGPIEPCIMWRPGSPRLKEIQGHPRAHCEVYESTV